MGVTRCASEMRRDVRDRYCTNSRYSMTYSRELMTNHNYGTNCCQMLTFDDMCLVCIHGDAIRQVPATGARKCTRALNRLRCRLVDMCLVDVLIDQVVRP